MDFLFSKPALLMRIDECKEFCSVQVGPVDTMLRGALLLSVSAFDFLMHEIIRIQILKRIGAGFKVTGFEIPVKLRDLSSKMLVEKIDLIVRQRNSFMSLVSSENFRKACLGFTADVWNDFDLKFNTPQLETRKRLDVIWRWRNRIAHEGDFVPSALLFDSWPIFKVDVLDALDFLVDLGLRFISLFEDAPYE